MKISLFTCFLYIRSMKSTILYTIRKNFSFTFLDSACRTFGSVITLIMRNV